MAAGSCFTRVSVQEPDQNPNGCNVHSLLQLFLEGTKGHRRKRFPVCVIHYIRQVRMSTEVTDQTC